MEPPFTIFSIVLQKWLCEPPNLVIFGIKSKFPTRSKLEKEQVRNYKFWVGGL